MGNKTNPSNSGVVVSVRGSVVDIRFDEHLPPIYSLLHAQEGEIAIEAEVKTVGRTGVEMEAMTAVSAAALTIYDMCKSADRRIVLTGIKLLKKSGGKSGTFVREN